MSTRVLLFLLLLRHFFHGNRPSQSAGEEKDEHVASHCRRPRIALLCMFLLLRPARRSRSILQRTSRRAVTKSKTRRRGKGRRIVLSLLPCSCRRWQLRLACPPCGLFFLRWTTVPVMASGPIARRGRRRRPKQQKRRRKEIFALPPSPPFPSVQVIDVALIALDWSV